MEQLSAELEEARALAEDRLKESEQLSQQIVQLQTELEVARVTEVKCDIASSGPYLALQSQFSVVQLGEGGWEVMGRLRVCFVCREQPTEVVSGGIEDTPLRGQNTTLHST